MLPTDVSDLNKELACLCKYQHGKAANIIFEIMLPTEISDISKESDRIVISIHTSSYLFTNRYIYLQIGQITLKISKI